MSIYLTTADIKAAALAYYNAGKLTAQHADPSRRRCVLIDNDGCRCAIGAALPTSVLDRVYAHEPIGVHGLIDHFAVEFESELMATMIQTKHDEWCDETDPTERQYKERDFLELIKS